MRKIKTFWSLDSELKRMLLEAYILLAKARIMKKRSFRKIAPALGVQREETSFYMSNEEQKTAQKISFAVHTASRFTFWESACLVKAIAAQKMLHKRGIETTLYLGTGKNEEGKFIAHAWLRSGPLYVTGAEGMERFTVVSHFAKFQNKEGIRGGATS